MEVAPLKFIGDTWNYIKNKPFSGVRVYRSVDGLKYLRIGEARYINPEVTHAIKLYDLGFPVPQVLEQGETSDHLHYFIEKSIGKKSFGDIFQEEYASKGIVSSNSIESFCDTICIFLHAQIKSADHLNIFINWRENIMMSNVLQENPDLDMDQLERCINLVETRLGKLPLKFSHGDLSPRNTFEQGVIDFEYGSVAPLGYDVLIAPHIERLWGFKTNDKSTCEEFYLNEEQISYYFMRIKKEAEMYEINDFFKFKDDFLLLKVVWSLAHEKEQAERSRSTTKWYFRKKVLIYCMNCYLNNKPIQTKEFKKLHI